MLSVIPQIAEMLCSFRYLVMQIVQIIVYSTLSTDTCPWYIHTLLSRVFIMTTHYFLCHPHLELSYCQFSFRYLICAGTLSYMHFLLPGVLKLTIVFSFWKNIMTVQPSLQFLRHFGQNKAYLIVQILNDFNSYDSYRAVNPAHTRCLLF